MKVRTALLVTLLTLSGGLTVASEPPKPNPYLQNVPVSTGPFVIPTTQGTQPTRPYEMSRVITPQEKQAMMRQLMPWMNQATRMNVRDVMNYMTVKYKAKPGLSFDDVVESMKLRANQLNFKLVGHSPMWKDFQAVLGDMKAPRVEVFHYCDIAAGREVLKFAPEALVFLPCRIGIMEDADKNIWVMTLDWDVSWLDSISGKMGLQGSPELIKAAIDIRDKMDNIMRAAAEGDL
jgi:uncharacterized protein (DUF302 family)